MLKLEDIQKDCQVQGIDPAGAVRIISADKTGENAITVIYKDGQGRLGERMLFRTDEPSLSFADKSISWGFDAPGGSFKLGVEALRIHLAYLFDPMMAIHTSNVDPLPHQITAVYESMLPRQPLRLDCFQSDAAKAFALDELEHHYEQLTDKGDRLKMMEVIGSPGVWFDSPNYDEEPSE